MLVVDGNNVMGSRPDGWWRDRAGAARRLALAVADWAAASGEEVLVVFDGRRPEGYEPPAGIEVRFAEHSGRNAADDVIAALVADDPDPARLQVVTSDAGLAERVRAAGASVLGAGEFRRRLDG